MANTHCNPIFKLHLHLPKWHCKWATPAGIDSLGQSKGLSLSSFISSDTHKVHTQEKITRVAPPQLPAELGVSFSFQCKGDLQFTHFLQLAEVCRGHNPEDHPQLGLPWSKCLIEMYWQYLIAAGELCRHVSCWQKQKGGITSVS